ncbi:MAG: hypothetical protein H7259_06305 [Cytophagales bacterium]|nr:hypothetical protein [Cytophaga sp.]
MKRILSVFLFSQLLVILFSCHSDRPNDDNAGNETFAHSEKNESVYDTGAYIYPDDKLFIVLNVAPHEQNSKEDKQTSSILSEQNSKTRKFLEGKGYKEYNPSSKQLWVFKNDKGEIKVSQDSLVNIGGVLIYTDKDSVFVYGGNAPEKDLENL